MRKCVDNDIDPQRDAYGKPDLGWIPGIFQVFPSVPKIRVVTEDGHQSTIIIDQYPKMSLGAPPGPAPAWAVGLGYLPVCFG